MKAVRYYGPGDIRIDDIPKPTLQDDELLIKVDACAVCGSDLKAFNVGNPRLKPPIVMGHEFTGAIVGVGGSVADFEEGDRIVMATSISCGECVYCQKGWTNLCVNLAPMGFHFNGGMAEYTVIPGQAIKNGHVVKVPQDISADYAALAEPLSCAVNSIDKCDISSGDTVLIMGAGPMGILNACVARYSGAGKIIMTEINDARLEQASAFDIDLLVNTSKENLEEIIRNETNGVGADIVIVSAPAAAPQEEALSLVRKNGTVCLFASLPAGQSNLNIDSRLIHYNEIKLTGSSDSTAVHVRKAVEMLANPKFPADKIASHILSLEKIDEAFKLMKSGEALRVVLKP
ncbi:alcohol dehydrogenase [Puteibacter caeruleilacunae]|nr:alcohol dehydrogenase [Puteibacter caeruleilacunae]